MATESVLKPDHGASGRHPIFTDEHDELRASVRAYVEKELAPHADEWEETTFPDSVFRRMGELGFLGLHYPEEYGGQGGDYATQIVLSEELSRSRSGGLVMGVAVHTDMANPPLKLLGTHEQKLQYLVPALKGEKIACLGITEPGAGSDVAGIQTTAVKDPATGDWIVNGSKLYITNGHRADYIVLVVKTDPEAGHAGFSLLIVDMDSPGVVREKLLAFQDVRVPAENLLGEEGKGFYHIMWELQGERLIAAAGAVAAADRLMERTLDYARERQAFGRSIGKFQGIRWKFAEMATKIEAGRQMTYATAWRVMQGEYPVREISMAKLYTSRMACEVADECLQIHGGAGYMKEYGIERAWRDLRLNRIGAGTDETLLEVIGRSYGL
jgi:alkylation response protein AidB-like acyl-CoA dehydrogenase